MAFADEKKYQRLFQTNLKLVKDCCLSEVTRSCRRLDDTQVKKEFNQDLLQYYIECARELLRVAVKLKSEKMTFYILAEDRAIVQPFKEYWDACDIFCMPQLCHHECRTHTKSSIQMYPKFDGVLDRKAEAYDLDGIDYV